VTAKLDRRVDLADLPGVHNLSAEGDRLHCEVDTAELTPVLARLAAAGVRSLVSRPPTLEELFLRHYGDELPGQELVSA
jgi:ABC-2 type transport system ATP-binding protein